MNGGAVLLILRNKLSFDAIAWMRVRISVFQREVGNEDVLMRIGALIDVIGLEVPEVCCFELGLYLSEAIHVHLINEDVFGCQTTFHGGQE